MSSQDPLLKLAYQFTEELRKAKAKKLSDRKRLLDKADGLLVDIKALGIHRSAT